MSDNRKRILVVDDEMIHRMAIRDRLEANGYEVQSVTGGAEALQILREIEFDLIILDLLMPQPDGFEVFRCLRESSIIPRTPVILFTVLGKELQIKALIEQGAHHLQKLMAFQELMPKVQELIGPPQ